jgi:hypothetical protein
MSKIEITNIRAEFSSEHMCESVVFEIDGTEHREIVMMTATGFQMPFIRQIEDNYFPGWMTLLDDEFDADTISEIHDQLSAWITENEGLYESGSDEPEVAEVWHGLFRSNGIEIVLTEAAAKKLDVSEGAVCLEFLDGYTAVWTRDSDREHEQVEFNPGSPEENDRGYYWAIRNPENVVLDAIRSRNEAREKELAELADAA